MKLNQDCMTAIVLLIVCGVMLAITFQMDPAMFGQMPATLWPRLILVPLALLSVMLLIRSQLAGHEGEARHQSLKEWLTYYKNPIICFALFFGFLLTMPILGMLLGGLAYVFLTLCFLGGWAPRQMALHAAIAFVFVTGMWAIFSQLLGVFLPEGILLRVY